MQILNRKAHFNYSISQEIEAGIILLGSEVKSIKEGKANLNDCYCVEIKGEIFLINLEYMQLLFKHQLKSVISL